MGFRLRFWVWGFGLRFWGFRVGVWGVPASTMFFLSRKPYKLNPKSQVPIPRLSDARQNFRSLLRYLGTMSNTRKKKPNPTGGLGPGDLSLIGVYPETLLWILLRVVCC